MPVFTSASLNATIIGGISFVFGILIAAFALNLAFTTGLADGLEIHHLHELFARIVIVVALAGLAISIIRAPNIPQRTDYELRVHFMLAIYAAGVLLALLDPFSQIRNELNVIRYPTALVLTIAGALLAHSSLTAQRHIVLRVSSGGLGMLLIAAAADEILEFHERLGGMNDMYLNKATGISSADMSTLFVAMAGILVALMTRRMVRYFAKRGIFGADGREVAAADLFMAAGIAFLVAMLLDTFDTVFSNMARLGLSQVLSEGHTIFSGQALNGYVETLANSIEELLEFAAAILLLSTAITYRSERR